MRALLLALAALLWVAPSRADIQITFDYSDETLQTTGYMRWEGTGVFAPPDGGGSNGGEVVTFLEWGLEGVIDFSCVAVIPDDCELIDYLDTPTHVKAEYGFPFDSHSPFLEWFPDQDRGRFTAWIDLQTGKLRGDAKNVEISVVPEPGSLGVVGALLGLMILRGKARAS